MILLGTPNSGVKKLPRTFQGDPWELKIYKPLNLFVSLIAYPLQWLIAPFGYFKSPHGYLQWCDFLPILNNEIKHGQNKLYKRRFESLNRLGLMQFGIDSMVYPF